MFSIIVDYFSKLFTSQNPTVADMRQVLDGVTPMIDDNLNSILCAPFVDAEVRRTLFDMHPDKALGPDGMSVFFYKKYWDVVGRDVTKEVLSILNEGGPLNDWNETIVTLIPKIKAPMTMKDYRPISLCNICYKIVARALTNKLRPILKCTVNEFQSAFIPGRLISDNIILGFEALHWIRNRNRREVGYAALKLDMSKAYDRMEWSFLECIMLKLGFDPSWVQKVMCCIRSVSYSFSLNDHLVGNLIPSRGLR